MAEKTPGTPRKDGAVGKDKAVQDPGLKDYVSLRLGYVRITSTYMWIASRGMPREGRFWVRLQSIQLGNRRSCCCQTDQARRPPKKRTTNDRGMTSL